MDIVNEVTSWIACALLLVGLRMIGRKKLAGFYVAGASEVVWIAWGVRTGSHAIVGMSTILLVTYALAVRDWKRMA